MARANDFSLCLCASVRSLFVFVGGGVTGLTGADWFEICFNFY